MSAITYSKKTDLLYSTSASVMEPANHNSNLEDHEDEDAMLEAGEAEEEITMDNDQPMDSDPEDDDNAIDTEIELQNDSIAHFDVHKDSLFSITSHPRDPTIIATGSGDDTAYVFSAAVSSLLLRISYESNPNPGRDTIQPIAHLTGHTDSVTSISFSLPNGAYLLTAGLDGRLRAYTCPSPTSLTSSSYTFLAESQEVPEIAWLQPCPHTSYPNAFALGASDGSVWVYSIEPSSPTPLQVLQAYYLHTAPTTAGAWSPSGSLLASASEEGSLYVYDPFGDASMAGVPSTGQALIGLTPEDQRFAVEGGLYSVAFAPSGSFLATGGAGGVIRIVGLPLLSAAGSSTSATKSQKGGGAKVKSGGGRQAHSAASGQAGQILASLQAQTDGIETLAFSEPPLTLLAAGSVDGSIALFDTAHRFAVRRHIREAHEDQAVVQVSFAKSGGASAGSVALEEGWALTSCGMDGVVRRWDTRGGTAAAGMGLLGEWRGHRGGGEGGGVMGFVNADGRVVTAGDDGVALVFDVGRS